MLSQGWGAAVTVAALALFAWVGLRAAKAAGASERDAYLTARGTQGPGALALSFFASVLGSWILFAPPAVGTFAGLLGVLGYAVGQAVAIVVFALVGPRVRARLPEGSSIAEFVRIRFGRVQQAYVGFVSVTYMFLFLAAELTGIASVLAVLTGASRWWPILAVAGVTALYTAVGGLPASIATDRWQGWLILVLLGAAVYAIGAEVAAPVEAARAGGLTRLTRPGLETAITLIIAITAANLFHQGFWQRVWSARDDRALVAGAAAGGALTLPVVFLTGVTGMIAVGVGGPQQDVPFFTLLTGLPDVVLALVVGLGVALVASSVDTLQVGLSSLVAVDVAGGRVGTRAAQVTTAVLIVPAAAIALAGADVLRLFLIADLLAATIVLPIFLGLWRRVTPLAALLGSVAGVVSVVVNGWVRGDGLADGLRLLTLPAGVDFGAFVAAPLGSLVVTVAVTLLAPRRDPRASSAGDAARQAAPLG